MSFGIERLKPIATLLLLPPLPFILLAAMGGLLIFRRVRMGRTLVLLGLVLTWLSGCLGAAHELEPVLLRLSPPLTKARIDELAHLRDDSVAIIALGSGLELFAPEFGTSSLSYRSLERLRYAVWLSQKTGRPVGFSGGVGWAQTTAQPSVTESEVAQRIATEELHHPLRWVEAASRDTRENARNTVALLRPDGIKRIVVVTHHWHMERSLRNFERAIAGRDIQLEAAPIGLASGEESAWSRWTPSGNGFGLASAIVREWLGLLSGA